MIATLTLHCKTNAKEFKLHKILKYVENLKEATKVKIVLVHRFSKKHNCRNIHHQTMLQQNKYKKQNGAHSQVKLSE